MKYLASPRALLLAGALIVTTNLALLVAADSNRRGGPVSELPLTERELALPTDRQDRDTGLDLTLVLTHEAPGALRRMARWKRYELPSVDYAWLGRDKLLELGFRLDVEASHPTSAEHYAHAMPRRAYVVVEYDGGAWSKWIADREAQVLALRGQVDGGSKEPSALADAEAVLAVDRAMRSRLFPVDAGHDAQALEARYGESGRHAVFAGLVRPKIVRRRDGTEVLGGEVSGLVVDRVHVANEFRQGLDPFLSNKTWNEIEERERKIARSGWLSPSPPRYRATLAVGRRQEPWLVSVNNTMEDE